MAHFHAAILARWPAVDLELLVSEAPLSHLPRRAHFAVIFDAPTPETGFDVIPLRAVPPRLLASPAYLARRGPIRSVADLADHAILRWVSGDEPPNLLRRRDGSFVEIAPRLVSNDVQVVRDMAGLGAGLAYAPDGDIPLPLQKDQELVRVLEDEICSSRTLELHVPAATRIVPKVRLAVEMLARLLGAGA